MILLKYGLAAPTYGEYASPGTLADLATDAERSGWDAFFVCDILLDSESDNVDITDPWVTLAAIAANTRRIRMGALVTPLARRRPWQVARETVALDHLSNGRLIFGAGLGHLDRDFAAFGEAADAKTRADKLDEGLTVINGLWSGEPFRFRGKHYLVDGVKFLPKPIQQPRIPIWIGGCWPNPRPFQRAARWDGIHINYERADGRRLTPAALKEALKYVTGQRGTLNGFDVAVAGITPSDQTPAIHRVNSYVEAGATWWIEKASIGKRSVSSFRGRICDGPPKA